MALQFTFTTTREIGIILNIFESFVMFTHLYEMFGVTFSSYFPYR